MLHLYSSLILLFLFAACGSAPKTNAASIVAGETENSAPVLPLSCADIPHLSSVNLDEDGRSSLELESDGKILNHSGEHIATMSPDCSVIYSGREPQVIAQITQANTFQLEGEVLGKLDQKGHITTKTGAVGIAIDFEGNVHGEFEYSSFIVEGIKREMDLRIATIFVMGGSAALGRWENRKPF